MATVKLEVKPVVYTGRKKKDCVTTKLSKINPVLIIRLTQELILHSAYYSKQT